MIAAAEAQRNVEITLKLIPDQRNQSIAKSLQSQVEEAGIAAAAASEKAAAASIKAAAEGVKAAKVAKDEKSALDKEETVEREHNLRERIENDKKAKKERDQIRKDESAEVEYDLKKSLADQEKARKEQEKSDKQAQKEKERAAEKADRDQMMRYRRIGKRLRQEREKKEREDKKAADDFAKAREREQEMREKRAGKLAVRDAKAKNKALQDEAAAVKKYHEKMASDVKAAQHTQIEAKRRATEAGVGALQGAMDLAEGVASLGLVSDENFEKFAKGFIKVQAGFRALKGFTELVWKGREALVAMSAATKAQATANAILSASNKGAVAQGAVTQGAVGAVQGVGIGGVATGGAAGLGLGGIAAAAGGLAAAAAGGLILFEGMQALRRGIFGASESSESLVGALMSWRDEAAKAEASTKRLEKAEKDRNRRLEYQQRFTEDQGKRAGYRQSLRESEALGRRVKFEIGGAGSDPIRAVEFERKEALAEVQAAEKEVADARKANEDLIHRGQMASAEERLRAALALEESGKRLVDADRQRLQVLRDQSMAAKEQLKALDNQQKSKLAQFGELSKPQQERFKALTEKFNRVGPEGMSDVEARQLGRLGSLGSKMLTEIQAYKGKQAGGIDALRASGNLVDEDKERRRLMSIKDFTRDPILAEAQAKLKADTARQQQQIQNRVEAQINVDEQERANRVRANAVDDVDPEVGFWDALWTEPTYNVLDIFKRKPGGASRNVNVNPFDPTAPAQPVRPQAASNAADTVTKESIEVTQSIKTVLDSVTDSFRALRKELVEHELNKKMYS